MTKQSILDRLWQHFVVERKPFGTNSDGVCRYRGTNGVCCGVGLFIPDDKYEPDMEEMSPRGLADRLDWPVEVTQLLEDVQSVHDNATLYVQKSMRALEDPYDNMQHGLERLASDYELDVPELP